MKELRFPKHILDQIQIHCEASDIAMAMIGSNQAGVCMIMLGDRELSPDQASIIAAHILLEGVITGGFYKDNEELLENNKKPIPKEDVN